MNNSQLYESVALTRDFPSHGLKRGDVATWIDVVPHPAGDADGLILEVFNALGESIDISYSYTQRYCGPE
jgi:hypothetical protein